MTIDIEDRLRRDLTAAVAGPVRPAPEPGLLVRQADKGEREPSRFVHPAGPSSRHRRVALVGVAAAIVVVVGSLGLRPWERAISASATPACRDNFAARGQPAAAEGLRFLPATVPTGFHLNGAWATVEQPCKPRAAGLVLLDDPGGVVRRAVTVWGPDASDLDFFSGGQRADASPTQRSVAVRGAAGKLEETGYGPRDQQTLGWTEPGSGQRWIATSVGLSGDELVSLAASLSVDPGRVALSQPATWGFHSGNRQPASAAGEQVQWNVDYQPDAGAAPDSDISVTVRREDLLASLSTGVAGNRLSDNNGRASVAFTQGIVNFVEIQIAPGVMVQLSGPVSADRLERLGASLQPAASDDARIRPPRRH